MTRPFDARARTIGPAEADRFSVRTVARTTWHGTRRPGPDFGAVVIETGVVERRRRGLGVLGRTKEVEGTRYTGVIGADAAQLLEAVRETGALPEGTRVAGTVFVVKDASPAKRQGAYYDMAGKVIVGAV